MTRPDPSRSRLLRAMSRWRASESAAGVLLIAVAALAVALANSPFAQAYHEFFHHPLGWTPVARLGTWHLWINDALMALFFFTVGLEIKREVLDGELSTPARRRLPVLAALAGMALPAMVYLLAGGAARGWAIPAATDIAFALGVLGLLGNRVPKSLRLFLLTVAIVDDLGAVLIIALVYTAGLKLAWLAMAAALLAAMAALNRLRVGKASPYLLLALALWYAVLHSGVHATVAGVLAALTIPLKPDRAGESLLLRLEHALVPWSAFAVVPLFGFANAGVALTGGASLAAALPAAVALGLLIGKQAGILGAIWLADRTRFAPRPEGATWPQLWGMALLSGIGFTMSLFIAALAFPMAPQLIDQAKLGVLAGSLASALLGYAVLRLAGQSRSSPTGGGGSPQG